jgi:hypothetical protein
MTPKKSTGCKRHPFLDLPTGLKISVFGNECSLTAPVRVQFTSMRAMVDARLKIVQWEKEMKKGNKV